MRKSLWVGVLIAASALGACLPPQSLSAAPNQDHQKGENDESVPSPSAEGAKVPSGFSVDIFVQDLVYPTSIEFDNSGRVFVAEAGYSYGDASAKPRIVIFDSEGNQTGEITTGLTGPINDILFHESDLYISHRGKISIWDERNGSLSDLVTGLPSWGDHHNNQMTVGPDGKLYFGQGVATNSGVVGKDNLKMGWLKERPEFHDVSPKEIKLIGREFATEALLGEKETRVLTSAFQPYGTVVPPDGATIEGDTKAGGTILRMNPDGSDLEVYAWGFRNPYGLQWSEDGRLYASENGFDVRGSRPIANDKEDLYLVKEGAWYGWPDFGSGIPVTDQRFAPEEGESVEFLLQEHPPVEAPLATFPKHSAIAKIAIAKTDTFGPAGSLFVTFFGHLAPMTGEVEQHGGHRVIRWDPATMKEETFLTQKSHGHGGKKESGDHAGDKKDGTKAASEKDGGQTAGSGGSHGGEGHGGEATEGPRRLLDVQFTKEEDALYVVDFGVMRVHENGDVAPKPGTGLVWRITPAEKAPGSPAPQEAPEPSGDPLPKEIRDTKEERPETADASFKDGVTGKIFHNYLHIKMALANSDAEDAAKAAGNLAETFGKTNPELEITAKAIGATEDLSVQRRLFARLTQEVEGVLVVQHEKGAFYKQFCPMAFKNKGAYWFSDTPEVENPYFGEEMLHCGEISKTFSKE